MSQLWKIIESHLDATGVREAEFARRIGTSPTTVNSWKNRGVRNLPDRRLLEAVAEVTGTRYDELLRAVLIDIGYAVPTDGATDDGQSARADVLVDMLLAAETAVDLARGTIGHADDLDADPSLIADLVGVEESVDELMKLIETAAEAATGDRVRLLVALDNERTRRREVARARRDKARQVAAEIRAGGARLVDPAAGTGGMIETSMGLMTPTEMRQRDHDLARREGAGKSRGQQIRDEQDASSD